MIRDKKEIGRRIRQIRNVLGLNQTQLGEHLGVVASSVSAYEKGETSPSFEMIVKIAKLGNISFRDLTGEPESSSADLYDLIKQREEAEGINPTDSESGEKTTEINSALQNLFASVDVIKEKLISKNGRSRNPWKAAFTGEIEVTEEDRRLLSAFHKLDEKRRARLIEDAEDMVLALGNRNNK